MTWDSVSNAVVTMVAILSGVFLIDRLLDLIKKYKKPSTDIAETLRIHGEKIANDDKRIKSLEDTVRDTNRMQNRLLLQMCNHMIDGNHTEKLIHERDEMENFLIEH